MKAYKRSKIQQNIRKIHLSIRHFKPSALKKKMMSLMAVCIVLSLILTGTNLQTGKSGSDSGGVVAAEVDALASLPGVKFSTIKDANLPDGMLLIGAYLIYDKYLTEPVYNLAVASMTTYNQPIMYYKSAMSGGNWLDLSSAAGLTDLQGKTGDNVKRSELKDYVVCAMVDSNGKMYSLQQTGDSKTPFNIQDPYDVMELPELVPVKLLYGGIAEGVTINWRTDVSSTITATTTERIDQLYEKIWAARIISGGLEGDTGGQVSMKAIGDGHNDTTNKMDKAITDLDKVYSYYTGQGNTQYMQTIMEAMGQADSARRAEVYYMLAFDGVGQAYKYIRNRQYDKLITKQQWAEQFMIANWGENWRYDDKWSAAIDKTVKNNSNSNTWSSVNYGKIAEQLVDTYREMYGELSDNDKVILNQHGGNQTYPDYNVNGNRTETTHRNWLQNKINEYTNAGKELPMVYKVASYTNKIDGSSYYSIVYLAYQYGWAISQAGDRLGDVRYWADKGKYDEAFRHYMSLMQRTGTTKNTGTDATYDFYVVSNSGRLNTLLQRLETADDLTAELRKNYTTDSEFADAVKQAIQSCEEAYYDYSSRLVENDDTLLGGARYDTMQYLINNAAEQSDTSVSREYNQKVVDYTSLNNIANDVIAEKVNELTLIENTLLPKAETNYLDKVAAGPDKLYTDAVAANQPAEVQQGYLDSQKAALDGVLSEYEYIINARVKRLAIANRIPYIDMLLNKAEGYYNRVRTGAFSVKANKSVDEFIEWLNELKGKCLAGSTGSLELDSLESQRANYEAEYMDALDKDDLDEAEGWKEALDDINAKIAEIKDSALDDFMNGDVKGASDAANLLGGTPQGLIEDIKKKAEEDIEDGDLGMMDTYISALGDLGGTDALNTLEPQLKGAGASTELLNKLGDAKEAALGSAFNDDRNGDGNSSSDNNGNGDDEGRNGKNNNGDDNGGNGKNRTGGSDDSNGRDGKDKNGDGDKPGDDIDTAGMGNKNDSGYDPYNNSIYDLFGKDFDDLNDKDKAAAFGGIDKYANQDGDPNAKKLAKLLLKQLLEEGNPFIYQKYMAENNYQYVNMAAVDRCRSYTGYRYIYKNGKDTLSQVNGSASYMFTVGLSNVAKSDGSMAALSKVVVSQTDITLDEKRKKSYPYFVKEDSEHYIDVSCYYIPDVIYAILLPQDVDQRVEELLGALEGNSDIN